MEIISASNYKHQFEKLITDTIISDLEFESAVQDLIFQTPIAMNKMAIPFVVRTSVLGRNEICSNISRCSYVPDSLKDNIPKQRCNFEGQQVFYATIPGGMTNFSDAAQPALLETTMQKIIDDPTFDSRLAAVSRWQIIEQPLFWFLANNIDSVKYNENFKFLFEQTNSFLKENSPVIEFQNFTERLDYLSQLFCRNSNKQEIYKVTEAFYNGVMRTFKPFDKLFDALIYPSANTYGEGMNIVLRKEYINNKNIYCDLVVLYVIIRNAKNSKDIRFESFAEAKPDELGNLHFKPIEKN